MKDRWYKWFPGRYRGKTMHLTLEQDALYRRLIDHYMETGDPLPDNEGALARIAGIPLETLKSLLPDLLPFFQRKDGVLMLYRCELELSGQTTAAAGYKRRSSLGGVAKAEKQRAKKQAIENNGLPASSTNNSCLKQSTVVPEREREEIDKIEEKEGKKESALCALSKLEAESYFCRFWESYPDYGGQGAQGAGFKGSRKKAFEKFYVILKKEKNYEQFTSVLINATDRYATLLEQRGFQACAHVITWLNGERWKDDYSTNAGRGGTTSDAIAQGSHGALQTFRRKDE